MVSGNNFMTSEITSKWQEFGPVLENTPVISELYLWNLYSEISKRYLVLLKLNKVIYVFRIIVTEASKYILVNPSIYNRKVVEQNKHI